MSRLTAAQPAQAIAPPGVAAVARKITLLQLVAATYFMVAGGPYALEELVQKAVDGRKLAHTLVLDGVHRVGRRGFQRVGPAFVEDGAADRSLLRTAHVRPGDRRPRVQDAALAGGQRGHGFTRN